MDNSSFFRNIPAIKAHYEFITPRILSLPDNRWTDPYCAAIDWMTIYSPIEMQTWMALRCFGKAPFYPQYPVGNYIVDFGNPKLKIAIECDGAQWHTDKDKDNKRDYELYKLGWMVFRISGSDCTKICENYSDRYEFFDDEERQDILREYYQIIEGLIKAIAIFYFGYIHDYRDYQFELRLAVECINNRISPVQLNFIKDKLDMKYNSLLHYYYENQEEY